MSPETQREFHKLCKRLEVGRKQCEAALKALRAIAEEEQRKRQGEQTKRP